MNGDIAFGYDSNPLRKSKTASLDFVRYALSAWRDETTWAPNVEFKLNAVYQDYRGGNDNQRLTAGALWSRSIEEVRGWVGLSFEAQAYRDQLVAADERDEIGIGLRFDRILSARTELGGFIELRQLSFRNPSLPWAGRPGPASPAPVVNGTGNRPAGHVQPVRRDDLLLSTGLESRWFLTASLDTSLDVHYARLDSDVPAEVYEESGLGGVARWQPIPGWFLTGELGVFRRSYGQGPHGLRRDDEQISATLSLACTLGRADLYLTFAYLENDSSFEPKSFQQTVAQSGLAWNFQ